MYHDIHDMMRTTMEHNNSQEFIASKQREYNINLHKRKEQTRPQPGPSTT